MEIDEFGQTYTQAIWTDADKVYLLPPNLMLSQDPTSIESWLASRVIPKNRAFVESILAI